MHRVTQLWGDESGTTSVEYAVMLSMILLVLIVGVIAFGNAQNGSWVKIQSELSTHGI